MFIKAIYDDYQNILYKGKEYSYQGYLKQSINANKLLLIKVIYQKQLIEYEVEYDPLCQRIINMVEKKEIHTS